eukprot:3935118-Rhodomonas_salina.2
MCLRVGGGVGARVCVVAREHKHVDDGSCAGVQVQGRGGGHQCDDRLLSHGAGLAQAQQEPPDLRPARRARPQRDQARLSPPRSLQSMLLATTLAFPHHAISCQAAAACFCRALSLRQRAGTGRW